MKNDRQKVTFVYLGSESLAIEILSSILKKNGYQTYLAFDPGLFDDKQYLDVPFFKKIFNYKKRLIKNIENSKPDLVAFSVGIHNYPWTCDIASEVKRSLQVPIIFGGIHPTSVPEVIIKKDFVDFVCIGEGDYVLVDMLDNIKKAEINTRIENIWLKSDGHIIKNQVRPLIKDLDTLPIPDKYLFEDYIGIFKGRYIIMTSRGCPFNCSYCYINVLRNVYCDHGQFWRQRSVDNVLYELAMMKKRYRFRSVDFMDDTFVVDKNWLKKFAYRYKKEIGVPYNCLAHTRGMDYEKALLLKESGCSIIKFGVQTYNDVTRRKVLNRHFENINSIEKALRVCDKVKLKYSIDHIFGIPYETQEDFKKTADFYSKTKACRINCFSMAYLPKIKIIETAREAGILNDRDIESIKQGCPQINIFGGVFKDERLNSLFIDFRKFYILVPILSSKYLKKILHGKAFRYLKFIPQPMFWILELLVSIFTQHLRGKDYFRYYLLHLNKRFKFWRIAHLENEK